jgi:citrate synthase
MSDGFLLVRDSRTARDYELPIRRNTILATDLKKIKAMGGDPADKAAAGLRVYDPGLQNTTVVESATTFT